MDENLKKIISIDFELHSISNVMVPTDKREDSVKIFLKNIDCTATVRLCPDTKAAEAYLNVGAYTLSRATMSNTNLSTTN